MASFRRLPRLLMTTLVLVAFAYPASGLQSPVAADDPAALAEPIPLRADPPSWWSADVEAEALLAAESGLAYDYVNGEPIDLAAAYPSQAFVRPGTQLVMKSGPVNRLSVNLCTAAFTFDQRTLLSTAGHCINVGATAFVVAAPYGIVFPVGTAIASVNGGIGADWALIAIDPQWQPYVDSDVALVGGPHGVMDPVPTARPTLVKHVGHGLGVGLGGTPRVGLLTGGNTTWMRFDGVVEPGDSGSPVLLVGTPGANDDAAGGIITHKMCERCTPAYATRVTLIPATLDDGDGLPL